MNTQRKFGNFVVSMVGILACVNSSFAQSTQVQIRLEVTDASGYLIPSVGVGDDFLLRAHVQDLRATSPLDTFGVFAAYMDVTNPSSLLSVAGPITYVNPYINGQTGDTSIAGLVNEIGAFDGLFPLGHDEFLLFTLPFRADAEGVADFVSDPADNLPFGFILVYGKDEEVPPDLVDYGSTTLRIVPEPLGASLMLIGAVVGVLGRDRRHPVEW